jgi:hypothetical protein
LVRKLACRQTIFGSAANPTHATATAMHFPANSGLIILTDKLTNDRCLVDTGATLSIVPCSQNFSSSGPLLKGADGQPIPSWGFIKKTVQFQVKIFTATFLQAAVAGPILGIDFLRKFKVTVSPEINQIQFACSAAALPTTFLPSAAPPATFLLAAALPAHPILSAALSASPFLFSSIPVQLGSNSAVHCDNFFTASYRIRICTPESLVEVVQL